MNIILRSAVRILRFSGGTNEMHRILLIIMLALAVGCAGAPESDDTSSAETESGCPSWMVAVEEDGVWRGISSSANGKSSRPKNVGEVQAYATDLVVGLE
jgi:hypothetical protein